MTFTRILTSPLVAVGEVLFPTTDWVTGAPLPRATALSEETLLRLAALASQNYCRRCGLTTGPYTANDFRNPCGRCHERPLGLRRFARVGTFSEPLVTLIHRLKFGRSWELARVLAPFLSHAIAEVSEQTATPVDFLIPVPLHWTRRARRGFNQAEELAREAAALSHWHILRPLRRIRRTAQQTRIDSPTRRLENLHGAFHCKPDPRLAGKHLWLIDDVSTTGATLRAAATALRKLPADCRPASLNAAVICVTDHQSPPAPSK